MNIKIACCAIACSFSSLLLGETTVRLAWENPPKAYDPRYAGDANSQYLDNLLHCSLVDFDQSGSVIPAVAESWEWKDPKTLVLMLRKDVMFADKTLVSTDDIIANINFMMQKSPKVPSPRASGFQKIESISASGQELTIKLTEPDLSFVVNNLVIGLLPKAFLKDEPLDSKAKVPGCGPFTLTDVTVSQILLAKNPNYNLNQPAKIDEIEIKFVKDESTRFSKLIAGEVDIVQNALSYEKIGQIDPQHQKLQIIKKQGLQTSYVGFNFRDPILKNSAVRQAIAHAINKKAIISYILKDMADEAVGLMPNISPKSDLIAFDPALANKILDEAGLKGNPRFKLSYKTTQSQTRVAIGHAIASDLKKIGIEVSVQPLEWGRLTDDIEKGRVQLWGLNWIGFKDPDIYRYVFASESFPPYGGNRGWYSNPEFDALVKDAKLEINQAKRKALYEKAEGLLLKDLPYVFLFHEQMYALASKNIEGFEVFADGRYGSLRQVYKK